MPARNVNGNSLNIWRGEVTEALKDIRKNQDEQWSAIERLGDRFEAALKEHAHRDEKRQEDFESRISSLSNKISIVEKSHSKLSGKVAVYALIIGAAISAMIYKVFS